MTKQPTISVIMPVYNGARYLRTAIESILSQTFKDFEFLIVNDGSTDDTETIALSYQDPRIKYVCNSRNIGIVKTLNRAICLSDGRYIARMDSDDVSLPKRFEIQLDFLENNPLCDMCGSLAMQIDDRGNIMEVIECPIDSELIAIQHLFRNTFIHPTTFFKADILKSLKYSDEYEFAEDYFLFARMVNECVVSILPDILLHYRVHNINSTVMNGAKMATSRKKVHFYQLERLLNRDPDKGFVDILESISINQYNKYDIATYEAFFREILWANILSSKYDEALFKQAITKLWFNILMLKSGKQILKHYFTSSIFCWSTFTTKHLRKMIKRTLSS